MMTLNMTLVSRSAIYQCSDFRISAFDRRQRRYVVRDDLAQKQILLNRRNWSATVAFTGLGSTDTINVAEWLAEQSATLPYAASYDDLLEMLRGAAAWLRGVPLDAKLHTFVVAGYSVLRQH
jgi:hypothetical protein